MFIFGYLDIREVPTYKILRYTCRRDDERFESEVFGEDTWRLYTVFRI